MVKKMTLMRKNLQRQTTQHEIFYHHLQELQKGKKKVQQSDEEKSKNILEKG